MKWRVAAASLPSPPPPPSRGIVVQLSFLENTFLSKALSSMRLGEDLLHTGLNVCLHHEYAGPVPFRRTSQDWAKSLIFLTKSFASPLQSPSMWLQREEKEKSLHNCLSADLGPIAAIWLMLGQILYGDHIATWHWALLHLAPWLNSCQSQMEVTLWVPSW